MKPDWFPLPKMEGTLENMNGCANFPTLDQLLAYEQTPVVEHCKDMTMFIGKFDTFRFEVMSFCVNERPRNILKSDEQISISYARED